MRIRLILSYQLQMGVQLFFSYLRFCYISFTQKPHRTVWRLGSKLLNFTKPCDLFSCYTEPATTSYPQAAASNPDHHIAQYHSTVLRIHYKSQRYSQPHITQFFLCFKLLLNTISVLTWKCLQAHIRTHCICTPWHCDGIANLDHRKQLLWSCLRPAHTHRLRVMAVLC